MTIDITTLLTTTTAARILSTGLELAASLNLPVTSWRVGDPTRVLFRFVADMLFERDELATEFIKGGFLSSATGDWLTLVAQDVYGVTRAAATYATPTVTLTNGGGGRYPKAAGELIVKASSTGATFRSTAAFDLLSGPGTTATVPLIADDAGSAGTVSIDDIDTIITTMIGVTVTASTAAIGDDAQSDPDLVAECQATLGQASPNGPPDAYNAVALNAALTGQPSVTRATTSEDDAEGAVTIWVASATGGVSGGIVTSVQDAIEIWATPAGFSPTVASAIAAPHAITYDVAGSDIPATAEADIESLLLAHYATIPIGGYVSDSALVSIAHEYLVDAGATDVDVTLTSTTGGSVAAGYVATVSSVTITEL